MPSISLVRVRLDFRLFLVCGSDLMTFLVSIKKPRLLLPPKSVLLYHPSGRPMRVVCIDVGLKYNQLRCLLTRGVEVLVVPWDYDIASNTSKDYDGLFISNGPGDPKMLSVTVTNIARVLEDGTTPVFGICLGHQLLARAAGTPNPQMEFWQS